MAELKAPEGYAEGRNEGGRSHKAVPHQKSRESVIGAPKYVESSMGVGSGLGGMEQCERAHGWHPSALATQDESRTSTAVAETGGSDTSGRWRVTRLE